MPSNQYYLYRQDATAGRRMIMANCQTCVHRGTPSYKSPCSECKGFSQYENEKKQTNADRIREMRDKELAVFLADKVPHGDCCDCRLGCFWTDTEEFESCCQKVWYEWLMLPAERDGENGEK